MSRVPTCPILASGGAALKDAARRQRGGLKAVLDRGSADRRRDFRPGRRNAPVQPNEETSLAAMPPLLHTLTDTTRKRCVFTVSPGQCPVVMTGAVSQVRCRFLLQPGAAN